MMNKASPKTFKDQMTHAKTFRAEFFLLSPFNSIKFNAIFLIWFNSKVNAKVEIKTSQNAPVIKA